MADFFQNSYRPLGPWVEHAHRVSFRSTSVNLVKLVLKLVWPMAAMFLRYANVLIFDCAPMDQDAAYQFWSRSDQRLPSYSYLYVFFCLIAPPSGRAAHFFLLTKDWAYTHVYRVWWWYLIFVQELYFEQHLANVSIDANWCTDSCQNQNFNFFR